jgi:hypothetical protein
MWEPPKSPTFWLGNVIMIIAMVVLLFIGKLWETMGVGAMVLWVLLAGAGAYLLMQDDSKGS